MNWKFGSVSNAFLGEVSIEKPALEGLAHLQEVLLSLDALSDCLVGQ